MVGELVKGGQPRPNLEGFAPASSPSSLPTRPATNETQGQEGGHESGRNREHQRPEHHHVLDPDDERTGERKQSTSRHLTTMGRTEFAWDTNLILQPLQMPLLRSN